MTKTTVKYIDSAAAAAVGRHDTKTTFKVLGGIRVPKTSDVNPQKESYAQDAARLRASLEKAGVEPLAVLPSSWWRSIVSKAGLLTILPDHDRIELVDPGEIINRARRVHFWTSIVGVVTVTLGALYLVFSSITTQDSDLAAFLFLATLLTSAAASMVVFSMLGRLTTVFHRIAVATLGGRIKRHLNPISSHKTYSSRNLMEFALPDPPESQRDAILKASESFPQSLAIATDLRAISLNPAIHDLTFAREKEERARQKELERQLRADPIVYVEHGKAVAIVAQYGEFSIEKEVIDQVLEAGW